MLVVGARVAFPAKVAGIDLHVAVQRLFALPENAADEGEHSPRALVRDLEIPLDDAGRDATLCVRKHHDRVEPERKWYFRLLENGSCRW